MKLNRHNLITLFTLLFGILPSPLFGFQRVQAASGENPAGDAAALAQPSSLSALSDPDPDPPEAVESSTDPSGRDRSLDKLANDLRQPALARNPAPLLVTVLHQTGSSPERFFLQFARSRPLGTISWVSGKIRGDRLLDLAADPAVHSIFSTQTFEPLAAPAGADSLQSSHTVDVHNSAAAHAKGFRGNGVKIAVVDTGVDFSHPDLQGTQARLSGGPYDGWPFAYDTFSGMMYSFGIENTVGPDSYWSYVWSTGYAHTLPVSNPSCDGTSCSAMLDVDMDSGYSFSFTFPDTSESGNYLYSVNPDPLHLDRGFDLGLGYASYYAPAAVLVTDEITAGVYDTVYVDLDFDQSFSDEKPQRRGDELAGLDVRMADGTSGQDGLWDIGAGMLTWISDGVHHPPGVSAIYDLGSMAPPAAGELIAFVWDDNGHGTNVAGSIASQSIISDPYSMRIANPLVAGGSEIGGVGGPVLAGVAPDADIVAIQNGISMPIEAWTLATLGFDGLPQSGDEAQLVNNSFANSYIINDGWDFDSRFIHYLNLNYAPATTFLASTGNGGHGYGTNVQPAGGTILDIGASTSHGTLMAFELAYPSQLTYGDIAPWSNRGPTTLGDPAPDVACVGAYATVPTSLNTWTQSNAQEAYAGFVGTSLSTPVCAGVLALGLQAFQQAHGRWPTWQEAHVLLTAGARDLGHDVLSQGAGNADADRTTDIGAGNAVWVDTLPSVPMPSADIATGVGSPAQWMVGDYQGSMFSAFPSLALPGQTYNQTFTVHNPTGSAANIPLDDAVLTSVHEATMSVTFNAFAGSTAAMPHYLYEVTSLVNTYQPDMLRAQVVYPLSVADTDGNLVDEDSWNIFFYDWTDLNADGNLWTDTDADGIVDSGEIDTVTDPSTSKTVHEYNRMNGGMHGHGNSGPTLEASIGKESISRFNDGMFLGLQRTRGSQAVTIQIRLSFYKKSDWSWMSLPASVSVPAGGSATFNATMAIPAGTPPGTFQGMITYGSGNPTVIPVLAHVASAGPTFSFGSASLSDPVGDAPYSNGHVYGAINWAYRYESGDWRFYYFDVPAGTAVPGSALVVDTEWNTAPMDINIDVLGSDSDQFSSGDPAFFGPGQLTKVGGSPSGYAGGGKFNFQTSTSGPREVIAAELHDGLGMLALHNVLVDGTQFAEPFRGQAYVVRTAPYQVDILASGSAGQTYQTSWTQTFTATADIPDGIEVSASGSANLTVSGLPAGPVAAGTPVNFTVSFEEVFTPGTIWTDTIAIGPKYAPNALAVPVTIEMIDAAQPLQGSFTAAPGRVGAGEAVTFELALTNSAGAPETVTVSIPVPALLDYVSGSASATIGNASFANDTVSWNGILSAGETLSLTFQALGTAGQGIATSTAAVSGSGSGQTLNLAAAVEVDSVSSIAASQSWAVAGEEVTFTFSTQNTGAQAETVNATIVLPAMFNLVLGSPTANTGDLWFDMIQNKIYWNGQLDPGQNLTLSYSARAGSGHGSATTLATFSMAGITYNPSVDVFVNPAFGLQLTPQEQGGSAAPGSSALYNLTVTNLGDVADSFDINVQGNSWQINVPAGVGPRAPAASASFTAEVMIPAQANTGSSDLGQIWVTSSADASQSGAAQITTTADGTYQAQVSVGQSSQHAEPGEVVTYTLRLTNTGSMDDSYALTLTGNQWTVDAPAVTGPVSAGAAETIQVTVLVPVDAMAGESDLATIQVHSQGNGNLAGAPTLETITKPVYSMVVNPLGLVKTGMPGAKVNYVVEITNTGNVSDTYIVNLVASNWIVHLPDPVENVTPGEMRSVVITVVIPPGKNKGDTNLATVTVTSQGVQSLQDSELGVEYLTLTTIVAAQQVFLPIVKR